MVRNNSIGSVTRWFLLVIALAAVLGGCGGGSTSTTNAVVTEQQRAQFMTDTNQRMADLPRRSESEDARAIAAFWSARPEVLAAGVTDGHIVWARFVDGQSFTLVLNYDVAPE